MQENMRSNYLKTPFIEEIAVKMRMHGFNRSTKEVETRLRTMKCSYTRIRKDLDAGWIRKPTWKYFDDVHAILGPTIIKSEQLNDQLTEPLDLSTSPTTKPDVNSFTPKAFENSAPKPTIKRTTSRTNLKKWIPVPLKTPSQAPISNPQHAMSTNNAVINETSTEQVFSNNDNHDESIEPRIKRTRQSLLRNALEIKEDTNMGNT